MKLRSILPISVFLIAGVAFGQTDPKLPCQYSDALLRRTDGRIALLTSDEMKARAVHKVDVSGFIKQADINGMAIIDLLVASDGHVICTKSSIGHPMIRKAVEDALIHWKFTPEVVGSKKVAYIGQMVFRLCQISCGDAGPSMSIVN